ncbi:MAG TPA: DUF1186 domain-containing protein [Xanthobacteraceae bacterium]|nr:DUF1186 domain-containing protein [Xanthobacteraceae bacterium]
MQVIEELGVPGRLPVEAIRAAQADRETMVPIFLRTIDDFLELEGPVDPNALFFIFHLLGEWREQSAYQSLTVFLRLPGDVLNTILGEAITETTHRVMAAVFDGDPDPLYEIIRDSEADEFVRAKMCQAIAMLTLRGDLPREATAAFLSDCYAQLEPQQDCYVWSGWVDAVAWLGLTELKPLVQQAFLRRSIHPGWLTFRDFEQDLQYSVNHPGAQPLHDDGPLTLFGETVAELSGWAGFKPKAPRNDTSKGGLPTSFGMPHREPSRKVGRNDPCPCGSGKKFKKCCLNLAPDSLSAGAPPWEPGAT